MSNDVLDAANELRDFLFEHVYRASLKADEVLKAHEVILRLFNYFIKHPDQMPAELNLRNDPVERRVADYIAGMTDSYAILTAERLSKVKTP